MWDVPGKKLITHLGGLGKKTGGVCLSGDASRVLAAGADGLRAWRLGDAGPGGLARRLDGGMEAVSMAFSPDGTGLAVSHQEGPVLVWDLATDPPASRSYVNRAMAASRQGQGVAWSPDGKRALFARPVPAVLRVREADKPATRPVRGPGVDVVYLEERLRAIRSAPPAGASDEAVVASSEGKAFTGEVDAVAWSPDGVRVAVAGPGKVVLWDATKGAKVAEALPRSGEASFLAFSPDGSTLVFGGGRATGEKPLEMWDAATGRPVRPAEGATRGSGASVLAGSRTGGPW